MMRKEELPEWRERRREAKDKMKEMMNQERYPGFLADLAHTLSVEETVNVMFFNVSVG